MQIALVDMLLLLECHKFCVFDAYFLENPRVTGSIPVQATKFTP
jgi:hypothetical protein